MPNDARLGLVLGVGLVIAVAVVFFRKEVAGDPAADAGKAPPAVTPSPADPAATRPADARTTARDSDAAAGARRHTVREGDTLTSLAKRYYGDEAKSAAIFRVNRAVLTSPDELPPGTDLVIPVLADADDSSARQP
jgi:nucleoid-associated protein YgaU